MTTASSDEEDIERTVLYENVEPHIARITLNRPHRRNAILAPSMLEQLYSKLARAEDDDDVKVVILAGAGRHFCAGDDVTRTPIETLATKQPRQRIPQSRRIRNYSRGLSTTALLHCDKTVIAAVQGVAYGLGFNLALCCDLIVAAEDATFSRRQSRIGFAGLDVILPVVLLKLGFNRGYEIILTGRAVSASELRECGAIASLVPETELAEEATRYARAVALHSTDGLMIGRQAKRLLWQSLGVDQYGTFLNIAHPLFTNLVWREDEANLFKERARTGSASEALRMIHQRWEDLGFE
jgi:enoyl-CoA hydratase/carnithine racemase